MKTIYTKTGQYSLIELTEGFTYSENGRFCLLESASIEGVGALEILNGFLLIEFYTN